MSLKSEIQAAIDASGAHIGVAINHLESGSEVLIHPDEMFPLCSVVKIPVLAEAFRQMAAGQFGLDDRWALTTARKNLGSGTLRFMADGLQPTVRDLLTLMIIISDNTATDMVIYRLGVKSIHDYMHELGLTNTHIPLTLREIFEDIVPDPDPTQDQYELAVKIKQSPTPRDARAYRSTPDNNVSTPRDMNRLNTLIFQGKILDRSACDGMLEILLAQQLNDRLPRFLPPGTRVAHKTGTLSGFRNDSGIIYLNDTNHVAVTAFSKWDIEAIEGDPAAERECIHAIDTAFGHIGRLVYDWYQNP